VRRWQKTAESGLSNRVKRGKSKLSANKTREIRIDVGIKRDCQSGGEDEEREREWGLGNRKGPRFQI